MDHSPWLTILDIGLILGIALIIGILAETVRIPDVTAFLVTGLALGPHGLKLLSVEDIHLFEPLARAAMALVVFEIGCQFNVRRIRPRIRRICTMSAADILVTATLVAIGVAILAGVDYRVAIMLGILAIETAPATTMLVLQEAESEGPVSEAAVSLLVFNNLACLFFFELVLTGFLFLRGADATSSSLSLELLLFLRDVLGSVLLGVAAAFVLTYLVRLVDKHHWFGLLVAVTVATLGFAAHYEIPYLLTFLAMGATVTNLIDEAGALVTEVKHLTGLLCVIFFVTHGAEMDPGALLRAGGLGVAYIALRAAGKYTGARLGARLAGGDSNLRNWLGFVLLAQAGTSLVLVAIAAERTAGVPELEPVVATAKTVILGAVVVFELAGPLLIRFAVVRAGEVPVAHAIRHVTTSPVDELRALTRKVLELLGLRKRTILAADIPVHELMRRTFYKLSVSASFDDIVRALQESHQDTFPVVDNQNRLIGLIRYDDLKDVLFDPALGELVRADDLAVTAPLVLRPDTRLRDIWTRLSNVKDDVIPVVNEEGVLVGILRPRDVFRLVLQAGQDEGVGAAETVRAVEQAPEPVGGPSPNNSDGANDSPANKEAPPPEHRAN